MKEEVKGKLLAVLSGALCGGVNGLFGGGGGMIVVPLLIGILKFKTKIAHATALLVILPVTAISAVIYIVKGKADLSLLLPVGAGVVLGGIAGAKLLGKLKVKAVTAVFSLVMLAAGVKLLFF